MDTKEKVNWGERYYLSKRNLYAALISTGALGYGTARTVDKLLEGKYVLAGIFGTLTVANTIVGILNYKLALKPMEKEIK